MSIAGIASSLLMSQFSSPQNTQTQLSSEFQKLSQDLQSGNLTQAQTDFSALQQSTPASFSNSGTALSQEVSTLGSDLKAGNLSAAQQDFTSIQQTVQQSSQLTGHHHHHHGGGGGASSSSSSSSSSTQQDALTQLLNTLGQDLQTGNISQAQQAYTSLSQSLQLFGIGNTALTGASTALPSSSFSVAV